MAAFERRSQLRNREIALAKLADLVAEGLAPEDACRRATNAAKHSTKVRKRQLRGQARWIAGACQGCLGQTGGVSGILWVLHVDLDQFIAAVEVLRRPELA